MKTLFCFFTLLVLVYASNAQTAFNLFATTKGQAEFASPSALGYKMDADSVDYSDIKGSPFWKEEWGAAAIVLQDGRAVQVDKVRLNFYTNDVHYRVGNGPELVAKTGSVKEIAFLNNNDLTKPVAYFESFRDVKSAHNANQAPFCQVLNQGNVQLLKLVSVNLDKKFDFAGGKMQSNFYSNTEYYLLRDSIFFPLKKINKENILAFVIPDADAQSWLATSKNKLNSEKDVVDFLAYYNKGR